MNLQFAKLLERMPLMLLSLPAMNKMSYLGSFKKGEGREVGNCCLSRALFWMHLSLGNPNLVLFPPSL